MQEAQEVELKPCPFCGGTPNVKEKYVECIGCFARTVKYMDSLHAIKAWNKRV